MSERGYASSLVNDVTRLLTMLRCMAEGAATTDDLARTAGLSRSQAQRLMKQAKTLGCRFEFERYSGGGGRYILQDTGPFRL